jgi:hypothetical protein
MNATELSRARSSGFPQLQWRACLSRSTRKPRGWIGWICGWLILVSGVIPPACGAAAEGSWKPAQGPLQTRWTAGVTPETAHREYPRPQLVRKDWVNLNGLWEFARLPKEAAKPESLPGQILVPFPVESALSGVMEPVSENEQIWYRRTFRIPESWSGRRVLVHFGAVDWESRIFVNGLEMGEHRGGYDAFSLDISEALKPSGDQELVVAAWDPTDSGTQPRGKQVRNPRGIWYTPTSGIWQTVWLEPVADVSIESLKLVPDVDAGTLRVTVRVRGDGVGLGIQATARDAGRAVSRASGGVNQAIELSIGDARLWSPDSPFLYDLDVVLTREGRPIDEVQSYFGMRDIEVASDDQGVRRLYLNGRALFQLGPLDQGFWPDGLYTAPSDEALRYDIEVTKRLGFNMARKHVKIEPDRWYYWCDRLGLLVWQDMPSGDRYIGSRDPDIDRSPESSKQFELELKRLIEGRGNHPCIVMWVPFNEGWGQYDTARITDWVKAYDPSRLVNNTSGWADRGVGDVNDIHAYPGPSAPPREAGRAGVLGEFGGLGLPLTGHTWQAEKNWGYRSFTSSADLTEAYEGLLRKLRPLTGQSGLAAAVYTQTTDVEIEVNGLMTYDREIIKMEEERVRAVNKAMYLPPPPPPVIRQLLDTSEKEGAAWRYTIRPPGMGWFLAGFDDSEWETGLGGFGTSGTPGSVVRFILGIVPRSRRVR